MKSFADLSLGDGGAPDLQELVEKYKGYANIPQDEWTRYDAELEHSWRRLRHLHKRGKVEKGRGQTSKRVPG